LLNDSYYIAMEEGFCNLGEFMRKNPTDTETLMKLLYDSCLGLQCLHNNKIVHRNIYPNNILVIQERKIFIGKISDFGLSKHVTLLPSDWRSSPSEIYNYVTPEVLRARAENQTIICSLQTDIYSMGITMFYILSQGGHPGGVDLDKRFTNVSTGKLNFEQWTVTTPPLVQFQSCIESMFCYEAENRPSINFVLKHPWSWNPGICLLFIEATANYLPSGKTGDVKAISDREELKKKLSSDLVVNEELKKKLSSDLVVNEVNPKLGWKGYLCQKVAGYLDNPKVPKQYRNYDPNDYTSLIKFIRDKKHHFRELPDDLKTDDVFGVELNTKKYIKYFTDRFPGLVPTAYMFLQGRTQLHDYQIFYDE
jgi:serine/threonine-protein kinase/endoribonuclease IRE1